jgi:hypothetical protein
VSQSERTQASRAAAELALVRVVHHYGATPEFVLLGGLVPQLLCAGSRVPHAGTTDIDVQVDLEIAAGSIQTARLERALRNAEFEPAAPLVWRWRSIDEGTPAEVRFELLADLPGEPAQAIIVFDDCDSLGAVNLRGTGFAARDTERRRLTGRLGGVRLAADVNVAGLAGFLLAKVAAARERRKPKDWYDVAFVLLHNDAGGVESAVTRVLELFGPDDLRQLQTGILDLQANFADGSAQGARAYVEQMVIDDPRLDAATTAADGVLAVSRFCQALLA